MNLWPHQPRSAQAVIARHEAGVRRIALTAPTGTGKTVIAALLVRHWLDQGKKVNFLTNRNLLLDQSTGDFAGFDLDHGVRAADHELALWKPFQISSIQTEVSRLKNPEKHRGWQLHDADLVIVDECHSQLGPEMRTILAKHHAAGATICGITATPIDLAQCYDELIIGCTMKEGRDCGALVEAEVYGPDEPDMAALDKLKSKPALGDDYSENVKRKLIMTPTIHGRVWDWWRRLNPDAKPTLGYAPGLPESLGFAEDFWKRGVRAAHIDGKFVWVDGDLYTGSGEQMRETRRQVLKDHRLGRIPVLFNFAVLREGLDLKWAEYLLLCTVFGSLQPYLQTIGRGLRSCKETGKTVCKVLDFGGNWWRHGSPNVDRLWKLEYTSAIISGLRQEFLRENPDKVPVRCPGCARIISSRSCPCGHVMKTRLFPRHVVQTDGTLKMMSETVYKKRAVAKQPQDRDRWIRTYHRAKKAGMTFRQAAGLFSQESGFRRGDGQFIHTWLFPDSSWPFMPTEPVDWFRAVPDVPTERLKR